MNKTLAIVMAGGAGERLRPLTLDRSKPAVPFGGKFRLIDFTLSNCINSGVRRVFVLTQYKSNSLHRHLQEGWGISSSALGDYIYAMPAQQKTGTDWYRGTADAVRQNLDLIRGKDNIEHILILSGDHIYKMNYAQMLQYHMDQNASLTISAVRTKQEEAASRLGVLQVDKNQQLIGFEEKPELPKLVPGKDYTLASMGVYIFNVDTLIEALEQGEERDFGKEVIPGMIEQGHNVYVYDYEIENRIKSFVVKEKAGQMRKITGARSIDSNYWRDVGNIDSYYEASMELLGDDPVFNLQAEVWPFRTFQSCLPPARYCGTGKAVNSVISDGCIIKGEVYSSILSPGTFIESGTIVENSVIFHDTIIGQNCQIKRAIIDKRCRINPGATLGINPELDLSRGCLISEKGVTVIGKGTILNRP